MNKEVLNLLVGCIFASLISGCAGDSDSKKADPNRETPQPLSELEKASCEFTAEDGEAAPSATPATKLTVSHFQKVFDESLVLPVLATNAMETVRFAKTSQLEIYSVGAMSTKSCKMFAFVPPAGAIQQDVFTDLQKRNFKRIYYLGVYFLLKANNSKETIKTHLFLFAKIQHAGPWFMNTCTTCFQKKFSLLSGI